MADGSRLVVKLNHTHLVADLRTYICTARYFDSFYKSEVYEKVPGTGCPTKHDSW